MSDGGTYGFNPCNMLVCTWILCIVIKLYNCYLRGDFDMEDDRHVGACGGFGFGGCEWIICVIIILVILCLVCPGFAGGGFI